MYFTQKLLKELQTTLLSVIELKQRKQYRNRVPPLVSTALHKVLVRTGFLTPADG